MMREQCNSSRLIFKSDIGTWDNSLGGWETIKAMAGIQEMETVESFST